MRSRHSLGILFISCFILPVIIILSYLNYQNKENYINGKEDALNKNFSSVEAQLSMLFNEMASTGGSISKSETIKEYLTDPKDEIANLNVSCALDTLVSQNDALNHIAIYDKSGILMPVSTSFVDGDYPNIATESMNYDIDANNGFTNINKYQIKGSRVNFISYICRISDGNTLLGYCVEYYDLSHITKILSNISSTSGFEIMLTDYNGNLIQTSYENIIPYTEHLKYNNVTEAFQNASNNSSTKLTEYNFKYNTGNNLIASQSLSITKNKAGNTWGVIMTTTMEQFMLEYNEIKNDNNRFVIPVFIIFIIAGAIYIFIYT
ncbi:MAG: hypothetical protein GX896_06300 [Clostridiales bacterium]|nr:hypothetical protein [Clostridiales bacterium]